MGEDVEIEIADLELHDLEVPSLRKDTNDTTIVLTLTTTFLSFPDLDRLNLLLDASL